MAAMTFSEATSIIQDLIDDDGSTSQTRIQRYINLAHSDVAKARNWPELIRRDMVQLTAPYTTGTVTTDGTTGVTGSGTAWSTAAVAGRKFALGYRSPFYEIASVGGETSITLADAYRAANVSGSTYVIYEDRVAMPSGCNKVLALWLHDDDRRIPLTHRTDLDLHGWISYTTQADTPYEYAIIERNSSNVMRVQVGPFAPDANYYVEVIYRADVTESKLAGDTGTNVTIDADRCDLVIQRALYLAYKRDRARAAQELAIYNEMLETEWDNAIEDDAGEFYLLRQTPGAVLGPYERWRDLEIT